MKNISKSTINDDQKIINLSRQIPTKTPGNEIPPPTPPEIPSVEEPTSPQTPPIKEPPKE